jgi:hypothetical protein
MQLISKTNNRRRMDCCWDVVSCISHMLLGCCCSNNKLKKVVKEGRWCYCSNNKLKKVTKEMVAIVLMGFWNTMTSSTQREREDDGQSGAWGLWDRWLALHRTATSLEPHNK